MTVTCLRCHRLISRYAPEDERWYGLCSVCARLMAEQERAGLVCGRTECLLAVIPHECLVESAAGTGPHPCPVESGWRGRTVVPAGSIA